VLAGLGDAAGAPQEPGQANDQADAVGAQRVNVVLQLIADDRELGQGGVQQPLLQGRVAAEQEAERGGPEPVPADGSVPPDSEVTRPAPAEPTLPQHTVEPTRTSMVWTMVGIGVVLLVAILVFILQNGQRVRVRFLMANGTLPLGVALLFAALLGALLVLVAGAARVLQLRVVARRHRSTDQLP
jgi:putative membrane protein